MGKFTAVDLFAGAGGMSLGFHQTNKIEIVVAVENNKYAQRSYRENHPFVDMRDDIRNVIYKDIKQKFGDIDIVFGGPPCQGFSNANRQKNELISTNNQLVKEYVKAIKELNPKAFVMENVKMMGSPTHKFFLKKTEHVEIVNELNIQPKEERISIGQITFLSQEQITFLKTNGHNLSPYLLTDTMLLSKLNSFVRHRNKINNYLANNIGYIKKVLKRWENYHQEFWHKQYERFWLEIKKMLENFLVTGVINSNFISTLQIITETQKVMFKMEEINIHGIDLIDIGYDHKEVFVILKTYNVLEYLDKKLRSLGYKLDKNILNAADYGVPQHRERIFIMGIRNDVIKYKEVRLPESILNPNEYYNVQHAIEDLEIIIPDKTVNNRYKLKNMLDNTEHPLTKYLNGRTNELYNHIITDSTDTALKRFEALEQGQNFHDLTEEHKTTYSNPSRTQNTVYQRLDYKLPSGTVLNIRKSMWVHPTLDRALSIREAARLQSFPDDYIFAGTKDSQYQQIGNAVPPLLARAVAERVIELLGEEVDEKLVDVLSLKSNILVKV